MFEEGIRNIRELSDPIKRGKVHSILNTVDHYAKIGDLAMQHNPEIVALVWAALRMTLQVSRGSSCSVA